MILLSTLLDIFHGFSIPHHQTQSRNRFEDEYYRYTVVGIYSICKDGMIKDNNNTSNNNNNSKHPWGTNYTRLSKIAAQSNHTVHKITQHWKKYSDYISFDVCYNKTLLLETLINIFLDIDYFRDNHPLDVANTKDEDSDDNDESSIKKKRFNIIVLFAYVPEDMSKIIESISSLNEFPRLCKPFGCDKRHTILDIPKYTSYLLENLERLKWFDVTLVSFLRADNIVYPYHIYYQESYELLRQTGKFCLRRKSFNIQKWAVKEITQILEEVANHSVLIMFADPELQIGLLSYLYQTGRFKNTTIITHEIQKTDLLEMMNKHGESPSIPPYWINIKQQQRAVNLYLSDTMRNEKNEVIESSDLKFLILFGWRIIGRVETYKNAIETFDDQTFHSYIHFKSPLWKEVLDFAWTRALKHDATEIRPLSSNENLKDLESLPLPQRSHLFNHTMECPVPDCGPGYVNVYGKINSKNGSNYSSSFRDFENASKNTYVVNESNESFSFDENHEPYCDLCPVNFVKYSIGGIGGGGITNGCRRCHGQLSIDNGARTSCIDPFKNRILKLLHMQTSILNVLVYSGLVLTLGISVLFLVHRGTVIVRVSDANVSLMHLGSLFVVYITVWLTYTNTGVQLLYKDKIDNGRVDDGDDIIKGRSQALCVVRLLIKTIPYTLNVALVYTKSEKLLSAFLSKIKLTPGEVRKTTAVQIFTVFCFMLVGNLFLVFYYQVQPPVMVYSEDKVQMHRIFRCDTVTERESTLNCFLVIGHLACLVQAFRGRKLPSGVADVNNAMSLVYVSLITTIAFGVSFPISFFQNDRESMLMQGLILLVNCHVMLVFLYGPNVFVILFKPHKNTRQYFNQKRLDEMSKGFQ